VNKRRKEALAQRALAYSNAHSDRGADSFSFEDGYRAAMRDMRKALVSAPYHWDGVHAFDAILHFLRPLR